MSKHHCIILVAAALGLSAYPSLGATKPVATQPFLCDSSTSSTSAVRFVNQKGKVLTYVALVNDADYGGVIFNGMPSTAGSTAKVTVKASAGTNTANLSLKLAVSSTTSGTSTIYTVSPTSFQNKGTYSLATFDFKQYAIPAGTVITNLAPKVVVSTTGAGGGSVYLYDYTLNGTLITRRIATTAGCLPQ